MLRTGKRDWLAGTIAGSCNWLSRRSARFRLLFEDIGGRLFLTEKMRLPAAEPRYQPAELVHLTDEFNAAAEDYFARQEDRDYLLGKPFTDRMFFARRLFDMGVLFHWLRLTPGETVLEIGAGSCWLSHILNRFGCRTIAVDVSATALDIGRQLFERDSQTNWELDPRFLTYDGHRLPLDDEVVDKVILYDAFHHIPNQEDVLAEIGRVLRDGGIIALREPGRDHAAAEKSLAEVREFGVLENDIIVEEIEKLAAKHGFARTTVVPLTIDESIQIEASELGEFMRGKHFRQYWERLCTALVDTNFILIYKGEHVTDTRRPGLLRARITPLAEQKSVALATGELGWIDVNVENTGDTLWLTKNSDQAGWTRLGGRLHRADTDQTLLDGDWLRLDLPRDLAPADKVDLTVPLPVLDEPGDYLVVLGHGGGRRGLVRRRQLADGGSAAARGRPQRCARRLAFFI